MTEQADRTADYFFRLQTEAAWLPFIRVFITQIVQSAGEVGANALMRQMGTQLALQHPLAQHHSLEELERSMNTVLRQLRWGWVEVQALDSSLVLRHGAFPLPSYGYTAFEALEIRLFVALLEALYQCWLLSLGGKPDVQVRVRRAEAGGVFEFTYGKSRQEHAVIERS